MLVKRETYFGPTNFGGKLFFTASRSSSIGPIGSKPEKNNCYFNIKKNSFYLKLNQLNRQLLKLAMKSLVENPRLRLKFRELFFRGSLGDLHSKKSE